MPRARLNTPEGKTTEWKSQALRAYQRRTLAADALIASTYLAGTNTRRVRRALGALFGGAVGKDTVSRTWRKVKSDWDAWNTRSLAEEPIVRLILDGTVVRVRLDRKATSISLLVVIGVREDGQKVVLARGSSTVPSSTAWGKPATGCSPSHDCRQANGGARGPPMRSNDCTRSSSGGSKPRPCCHRQIPRRCCSGRCSHRARSICARSMVGRRSQQNSSISQLTSLPEAIPSCYRRSRHAEFQPLPGRQL